MPIPTYPPVPYKGWIDDEFEMVEPHHLVYLEATGGTDICGEWHWSGGYRVRVEPITFGNFYHYEGNMYGRPKTYWDKRRKRRVRRYKYDLHLRVVASGGHSLEVGKAKDLTKEACKKMAVHMIKTFEKTNRFKEELWPRVLHPDNRIPICKMIDGNMVWIATTWGSCWDAVQQQFGHGWNKKSVMGYGDFYYRKIQYDIKYPRKGDDGWPDYSYSEKHYKEPHYGHIQKGAGYASGGGLDVKDREEKIRMIDEAIFDVDNDLAAYINMLKYQKLKITRW
jgi:hypothetical protein